MTRAARNARRHPVPHVTKIKALVKAASIYGEALRRQATLSTALHRAESRGEDTTTLDRDHSAACDAVGAAEHELLVCGAVVSGWSRRQAEKSV